MKTMMNKLLREPTSVRRLLLVALFAFCNSAMADTMLKLVTNNGVVSFVADDQWPVVSMQSKLPVAAVAFQLPNAADEDTPHSTNLVLKLYDQNSEKGKSAYAAPAPHYGAAPLPVEKWQGWTISRQETQTNGVPYTILDAKRPDVGDVSASARLAWPHLAANARSYDRDVELRFRQFLQSVQGKRGKYEPQEGEVVRRPAR
jgi:hypothetical protein